MLVTSCVTTQMVRTGVKLPQGSHINPDACRSNTELLPSDPPALRPQQVVGVCRQSSSLLDEREGARRRAGRLRLAGVRPFSNETRLLIVMAMEQLNRPATSAEIYGMLDGSKPLALIEYHLCVLVMEKSAEIVFGPELLFRLTPETDVPEPLARERCR